MEAISCHVYLTILRGSRCIHITTNHDLTFLFTGDNLLFGSGQLCYNSFYYYYIYFFLLFKEYLKLLNRLYDIYKARWFGSVYA